MWVWLAVAAVLFVAIVLHEKFARLPDTGPVKVLPSLKPAAVTSIQVLRPKGQLLIRAERTNGLWQLAEPAPYPAQAASVESLLAALERLAPAAFISAQERQNRPGLDEEEGFAPAPQATILIQQGDARETVGPLDVGARTAPGDQLYVQVAGVAGVYVVDAGLLRELPRTKDDWRDTTLIDLNGLLFDRVVVTNGTRVLELQQEAANHLWRIINPPSGARADAGRIRDLLQQLQTLRASQFLPDDPKPDLEALGLQPPELALALMRGTNPVVLLQFGKSPTNSPALVYARRLGRNTILTVPTNALAGWHDPVNAFRAPHLVELPESVATIEVQGPDNYSVQRQGTNGWRVLPPNWPADAGAVGNLLNLLSTLPILEFIDAVTAPEWAKYGLAVPARRFILRTAAGAPGASNAAIVEVDVGTNKEDRVFVRRADESSVYAVRRADLERWPTAAFQLRERHIWNFKDDDVARVTVRRAGKVRQLIHTGKGLPAWALAPGVEGTIEPMAVGQTVRDLGQLTAANWVAHGEQSRARYGFAEDGPHISLELANGDKPALELGGPSPSNSLYGAVSLEGELWVFEFPAWLSERIQAFLFTSP